MGEDQRKLSYIRSQITKSGLAKRASADETDSVVHLHQVAKSILKRYE